MSICAEKIKVISALLYHAFQRKRQILNDCEQTPFSIFLLKGAKFQSIKDLSLVNEYIVEEQYLISEAKYTIFSQLYCFHNSPGNCCIKLTGDISERN